MKPNSRLVAAVGASCATLLCNYVPKFEGIILRGYKDPVGIVTACAGHTKTAILGRAYTTEECERILNDDLLEHSSGVRQCLTGKPTVGQFAAFTSFAYNVGTAKFCASTMAKKANAGDMAGACAELSKWVYAGGRELPGLVTRRASERSICEGKMG